MTVESLSKSDAKAFVLAVLSEYAVSFQEFLDSDLDDFEQAQLRDLWLMFHDLFTSK